MKYLLEVSGAIGFAVILAFFLVLTAPPQEGGCYQPSYSGYVAIPCV